MSIKTLIVVITAVFLSACAQLLLKIGVAGPSTQSALWRGGLAGLLTAMGNPIVWGGFALYGLSMVLWLWVLAKLDLSLAYPFVGLSFIVTMVFGAMILGETVTPLRFTGTVFIALGCVMVAQS